MRQISKKFRQLPDESMTVRLSLTIDLEMSKSKRDEIFSSQIKATEFILSNAFRNNSRSLDLFNIIETDYERGSRPAHKTENSRS